MDIRIYTWNIFPQKIKLGVSLLDLSLRNILSAKTCDYGKIQALQIYAF